MHADVFADPTALGRAAAELIVDAVEASRSAGRPFLLGCPGGRSPLSTYQALAELTARRRLDLGHLVIVMMDEYLVPAGPTDPAAAVRFERVDPAEPHSCLRFARDHIIDPLTAAAGPGRGISADRLWMPDPADPARYDQQIRDAGGVGLFLLASGAGDGHIAFNPPGSDRHSTTCVVELPKTTRRDNLATFPSFAGRLERVPRHGVTVGIETIVEQSQRVLMLVHGTDKAEAFPRLEQADRYEPDWPATCYAENRRPTLFADSRAAGQVARST